jgi:hypothetical protein
LTPHSTGDLFESLARLCRSLEVIDTALGDPELLSKQGLVAALCFVLNRLLKNGAKPPNLPLYFKTLMPVVEHAEQGISGP